MTKFYVDNAGKYLGGFDGALPPDGSIEVQAPPPDGRMTWDGSKWIEPAEAKDEIIEEKREEQIRKEVSPEDKINALWLKAKGDNTEFDRIDLIITKAEQDFPKA